MEIPQIDWIKYLRLSYTRKTSLGDLENRKTKIYLTVLPISNTH